MENNGQFPRDLTPIERDLLLWILPKDRPGYREYRTLVESWKVVARGRRGEGNYILAEASEGVDNESPLPQILAQGVVETKLGAITVTIRERFGDQVEYEIDYGGRLSPSTTLDEMRRWTFSTWEPHLPCPICETPVREVQMKTEHGRHEATLAICAKDRRLWVYHDATGVNYPIPVTNIYNELVMHKNIRDPKIAFDSQRLFSDLATFSDTDLTKAFVTYNTIRTKVRLDNRFMVEEPRKRSLLKRLFSKA